MEARLRRHAQPWEYIISQADADQPDLQHRQQIDQNEPAAFPLGASGTRRLEDQKFEEEKGDQHPRQPGNNDRHCIGEPQVEQPAATDFDGGGDTATK